MLCQRFLVYYVIALFVFLPLLAPIFSAHLGSGMSLWTPPSYDRHFMTSCICFLYHDGNSTGGQETSTYLPIRQGVGQSESFYTNLRDRMLLSLGLCFLT